MKKLLPFLILIALSCQNKEAAPDCSCDGPVLRVITKEAAVYRNGFFIVKDPSWYAAMDCNSQVSESGIVNGDSVFISGKIHYRCPLPFEGNTFMAPPTPIELTEIRKK